VSRALADFIIPAREARAFLVPRGARLRIHLVEEKQVGDCCFFNADDRREVFHVGQTWALNVLLGTGNAKSFKHFYSKPPRENVMLTVVEDTVRNHWGNMGGRCSRRLLRAARWRSHAPLVPGEPRRGTGAAWPDGRRHRRCLQRLHERRAATRRLLHHPSADRA
jgi:uncharacterized protein YcgI (DUF1989 family)